MKRYIYYVDHYVYELSIDGIVFYVGSTIHPLFRYKQHCSCGQWMSRPVIYSLLESNKLPDFKILYKGNREDAREMERLYIIGYNKLGVKLCNIDYNDADNVLTLPHPPKGWKKQRHKTGYTNHIEIYINNYINETGK